MTKCGGLVPRGACGESQPDLSGRWNETDAKVVADEMIGDMLDGAWLQHWSQKHDEPPAVVVGAIQNETEQHVDKEVFVKDIARNLVNSDSVQFVEGTKVREAFRRERANMCYDCGPPETLITARDVGAEFLVHGTIHSAVRDTLDGDKVSLFYTINLELVGVEENRKVWLSEREIKKIAPIKMGR